IVIHTILKCTGRAWLYGCVQESRRDHAQDRIAAGVDYVSRYQPWVGGGGTLWGCPDRCQRGDTDPPVPPSVSHSSALPLGRGCLTPCQLTRLVYSRLLHPAVRVGGSHLYRVRLLRARLHLPVGWPSHTHYGLSFTEFDYYEPDSTFQLGGRVIHTVTEQNVTTVQWLMTPRHYLVIDFSLERLEGNHLRVLDDLLEVYGFNITYEIRSEVRNTSCSVIGCSLSGHCYASRDFRDYWCACFEGFSGPDCGQGPLCQSTSLCKNGATCR
ncbi:hypothetical protein J6590_097833, partial [Homalodisca vitripennis]